MNPLRALRTVMLACRTTRRLDDRVREAARSGIDPAVLHEQATIDAELADRRATPWRTPGSSLRIDVMSAVHADRARRASRSRTRRPTLAAWSLASAVAVASGLALVGGRWPGDSASALPAPSSADPQGSADSSVAIMDIALEEGLDLRPVLGGRMEEPLRREARALREDTARAAGVLMDGLTLETFAESAPR